jgi:hypothetical protein
MPFYEKGDIRIRYEMVGSGFPLLVTYLDGTGRLGLDAGTVDVDPLTAPGASDQLGRLH